MCVLQYVLNECGHGNEWNRVDVAGNGNVCGWLPDDQWQSTKCELWILDVGMDGTARTEGRWHDMPTNQKLPKPSVLQAVINTMSSFQLVKLYVEHSRCFHWKFWSENVVDKFAAWPLPLPLPVCELWVPAGPICMRSCTVVRGPNICRSSAPLGATSFWHWPDDI